MRTNLQDLFNKNKDYISTKEQFNNFTKSINENNYPDLTHFDF